MKKHELNTLAVILARTGSKRLKNKLLKKIGSKKIIELFIERLKKCKKVNKIILATTYKHEDKILIKFAKKYNIDYVRGPEKDVLKRIIIALKKNKHTTIIRANADCPLLMPTIVDNDIKNFLKKKFDLYSPFFKNLMPFGYSFAIFRRETLFKIYRNTKLKKYREHIENYCYDNPNKFKILKKKLPKKSSLYCPNLFLTLDTLEDYLKIKKYFQLIKNISLKHQPSKLIEHFKKK